MCEEVEHEGKVPVHGRSRDNWPDGRAGPRRIIPDPIPDPIPRLYTPARSAILNYEFQWISIDFLHEKIVSEGWVRAAWDRILSTQRILRGLDRILSTQRIPGGDLVEISCFTNVKLVNNGGFSDFDRGTMRENIAIFKKRNSVCRGTKSFERQNLFWFYWIILSK